MKHHLFTVVAIRRTDNEYLYRWSAVRTLIFVRDDWQCQICGSTHNLRAHHICPPLLFATLEAADQRTNLVTLCDPCHLGFHSAINRRITRFVEATLLWAVGAPIFWLARRRPLRAVARLLFLLIARHHIKQV